MRGVSSAERFWAKVNQSGPVPVERPALGPCWVWTAGLDKNGYGQLKLDGRMVRAHRFAIVELVGPIPDGLEPDHLCFNRACVKAIADEHGAAHLELVTHRENARRGRGPVGVNARKTHCVNGHEFTPENTYIPKKGARRCRECTREKNRASARRSAQGGVSDAVA